MRLYVSSSCIASGPGRLETVFRKERAGPHARYEPNAVALSIFADDEQIVVRRLRREDAPDRHAPQSIVKPRLREPFDRRG